MYQSYYPVYNNYYRPYHNNYHFRYSDNRGFKTINNGKKNDVKINPKPINTTPDITSRPSSNVLLKTKK